MNAELIFKYFQNLTDKQRQQFTDVGEIYNYWNRRINVISRKDMDNFYLHHVLHSLVIARLLPFKAYTKIMDAGTGGGFPGIPLAVMFPEVQFYLVDSIGKKIKVVKEVVHALDLKNVEVEQIRAEQVTRTFDFVVSRAVTDLEVFVRWTFYKIHSQAFNDVANGIIYLKGIDIRDEINRVKKLNKAKVKTYPLSCIFEEEFFKTKQIVHIYK